MGLMIDGHWHDVWYDTSKTGGKFKREPTQFHFTISNESNARFTAEKDAIICTYHLPAHGRTAH